MITRVRGTDDVLNLDLYNFVLDQIKHHLATYNFHEIDTPILEPTELFVRAVGQETDIVSKEMYVFQTAGGESICLRPEATASIIRAYIENGIQQATWKVFVHGPMFRHERPQKGRWRQFNQLSIENIGITSIAHDAQLLKLLDSLFYDVFKLENYVLKLNFLGCLNDRKEHKKALLSFLDGVKDSICQTCVARTDKNTLRVFDCKSEVCQGLYAKAPKITDFLCAPCAAEWAKLQQFLKILSVNYVLDPMLVRGLDYYNQTVFEFTSSDLGAQSALCGGGRYDLGKEIGDDKEIPSIGVGIGMRRLVMILEKNLSKLVLPQQPALHVIIPFSEEQVPLGLLLAYELQSRSLATEVLLEPASISNQMKKANKLGAKFALIIGPDEQKQGIISVKNMQNGQTASVKQADITTFLRS